MNKIMWRKSGHNDFLIISESEKGKKPSYKAVFYYCK